MNNWYTADPHFGSDSFGVLKRDNRPFKDNAEYTAEQVRIWNEQASSDDTIYVIGDFCNYNVTEKDYISGLAVSKQINAHIILITGNSEDRVIRDIFGGDYEKFREYCLTDPAFKFRDVIRDTYIDINGESYS
ncbi:MAG: metallophosphoesterase [Clostridiales bacterium]|nr:metallophosphoesterase [Clostridiales bacterium]